MPKKKPPPLAEIDPPRATPPTTTTTSSTWTFLQRLCLPLVCVAIAVQFYGSQYQARLLYWWQERHSRLDVHRDLQFTRDYALGSGFQARWRNGSLSIWSSGADAAAARAPGRDGAYSLW